MPEVKTSASPVPTVRAYLKRRTSRLLLVSVRLPSLPRPIYRSYPVEVGEAEAVSRAVGRALSLCCAEQRHDADKSDPEGHGLAPSFSDKGAEQPFQPPVVATQHRRPPQQVRVVWQGLLG